MAHDVYDTFEAVKLRLDEIVDAVNDESLPLDDALALYEEAVTLGLRASDLLEEDIEAQHAEEASEEGDATAASDADAVKVIEVAADGQMTVAQGDAARTMGDQA